jgi:pimeloyl-ACP methyl ester carboxylesterase
VLLRGVERSNPVLLFLHDGPGLAQIHLARHMQRELERAFVVANWDQRGSGLSYDGGAPPGALTLDRLVEDTVELSRWLCRHFQRDRILLVGNAWGSILGLMAVRKAPELFDAYVGVDQWVEPKESEERLFHWAQGEAKRRDVGRAIRELAALGGPPYPFPGGAARVRRWAERFGGVGRRASRRGVFVRSFIDLQEYTVPDLFRWRRGVRYSLASLGAAASSVDLSSRVTSVDVPTYFLSGRDDRVCDPELPREYLRVLDAPRKGWAWIEDAAHFLPFEQPDALAAAIAHFALEARGPPAPAWRVAG